MTSDQHIIDKTKNWMTSFIVKLNICPFAKRELARNSIKYNIVHAKKRNQALESLLSELCFLDKTPSVETTLMLFPFLFKDFYQYLDFVDGAECHLNEHGYDGIYQLATFHPNYCFADTEFDDVSNFTNRSPYPMIHILREESLEKAITNYGNTEDIPQRNIETLKNVGAERIKQLLRED